MSQNTGFQGVAGCVTSTDPVAAGFNKHPYSVKTVDDCLDVAKRGGVMCGPDKNAQCAYFIFTNRTIDDKLREADIQHKNGNDKNAILNYLLPAWTSMPVAQRKQELLIAEKTPERFLNGFGGWVTSNPQYMSFFKEMANDTQRPLPLEGNCWVGGHSVTTDQNDPSKSNPNIIFSDAPVVGEILPGGGVMSSTGGSCKYNLFEVPAKDVGGAHAQQKIINTYHRRVARQKKQLEDVKKKLKQDMIALEVAQKHTRPEAMIAEVYAIEQDMRREERRKPYKEAVQKSQQQLSSNIKDAKVFNYLAKTTSDALKTSDDLLGEKKDVVHKLNADIDNINWSLEKTNRQEILQNKITTTLGILILLFVALCVGLLIYYLVYETPGGAPRSGASGATKNTGSGVLGNIVNFKKPKGFFNRAPAKGAAGNTSNKSAINKIFNFGK
jgi:hypothetical protein